MGLEVALFRSGLGACSEGRQFPSKERSVLTDNEHCLWLMPQNPKCNSVFMFLTVPSHYKDVCCMAVAVQFAI